MRNKIIWLEKKTLIDLNWILNHNKTVCNPKCKINFAQTFSKEVYELHDISFDIFHYFLFWNIRFWRVIAFTSAIKLMRDKCNKTGYQYAPCRIWKSIVLLEMDWIDVRNLIYIYDNLDIYVKNQQLLIRNSHHTNYAMHK